ncbi:hypothetical protein ACFZ8E_19820 [Methylobacterium sp. HMF5984]|uniref:hypothetical protein n=1 Tax=Methylobacterium sp. HMF5984 TaxID=3367370 RepID=UPI00385479D9
MRLVALMLAFTAMLKQAGGALALDPGTPGPLRGPTVPARRIILPPTDQGSGGDVSKFTVRIPGWNDGRKLDDIIRDFALAHLPDFSAAVLGGVQADTGVDQTARIVLALSKVPGSGGRLRFPCGQVLYSAFQFPNPRTVLSSASMRCTEMTTLASAATGTSIHATGVYSGIEDMAFVHVGFDSGAFRTSGYTVDLDNGYGWVRRTTMRGCFMCVRMGAAGGAQWVQDNTFEYSADGAAYPGSGYILVDNSGVGPNNIISGNLGLSNFFDPNPAKHRYPDAAVIVIQTGELYSFANDWISNRTSYKIIPGNGQRVEKVTLAIGTSDSAQAGNIVVQPRGTGYVMDLSIPTPWITNSQQVADPSETNVAAVDAAGISDGIFLDATLAMPTALHPYPINMVSITGGGQITSTKGQRGRGVRCQGPVYNVTLTSVSLSGWEKGLSVGSGCQQVTAADNKIGKFSPFDSAAAPSPNATNKVGIDIEAGSDAVIAHDNNLLGNTVASLRNASTGANNRFHDNVGYNPAGSATLTLSASPMQLGPLPTMSSYVVYGGSSVSVTVGAANGGGNLTVCPGSPCSFTIPAGQLATMTYTAAPTVNQILH